MDHLEPLSYAYNWTSIAAEYVIEAIVLFFLYFSVRNIAERSKKRKVHVGLLMACLILVVAGVSGMYEDYMEGSRTLMKFVQAPEEGNRSHDATPEQRAQNELWRTGRLAAYRDADGLERRYVPTQQDLELFRARSELIGTLRVRNFRKPIEIARVIVLTCTFIALGLFLGLSARRREAAGSLPAR